MTPTLDAAFHHPARIRIASRLRLDDAVRFARLREATELTSGNLASHIETLERAGYVRQWEGSFGVRPGKLVALTVEGRAAFDAYVSALEALVAELRGK